MTREGSGAVVLESAGAAIVNPASAGGATGRRWPTIRATLQKRGLEFETFVTEGPGHAGELAQRAASAGARWIVCVGGDGTFNEVVNGLADSRGQIAASLALGFIPSGTGLDLARNVGVPVRADRAAEVIGRSIQRIDLGRVVWSGGLRRLFVNMAGTGFDAEVASRVIPLRRYIPGKLAYVASLFLTLPSYADRRLLIEFDDDAPTGRLQLKAKMVVACNGRSYGGGMLLVPQASIEDGFLDVFVLESVSALEVLRWMPQVYRGTHLSHPAARVMRGRSLQLSSDGRTDVQTDGEPVGALPATIDVVPRAVSLLT